jgi:thioesterase domain-containing protein/acyl carrier protein
MKDQPGIKPDDVLLAVTTVSFDIAGLELYLPLIVGATVVIATSEEAMDARLLAEKIDKEQITFMQATPVTWRMLMITNWHGNKSLKALCGGEALQQDLGNQLVRHCSEVWNVYGPTETTIWSTLQQVKYHEIAEGYEPIGKAIANTTLYILDNQLNPVPIGVPGELFIGGDGVAKGYYNRPDLTKERFLNNPYAKSSNQRIYRTGDQVKMLHDGTLVYLNRLDNQVKIRGFRIELGEIEAAIARVEGIVQNVVIVREDTANNKRIVAYLIAQKGSEPDKLALRNYLSGCLPEYMIPAAFVVMEQFPLTPNGKIDRKLLPQPDSGSDTVTVNFVEPSGFTERMLAEIWKDLLKMNKVSATDDFFDLGGHSLLAVSLMGRIEQQTNKRLPLATLFMNSSLRALAQVVDNQENASDWRSLVRIKPFGNMIPLFLVHGAGLNVLLYNTLINNMSIDQPVYGLQAKGLNGVDKPLETMEEIALHYIAEIKTEFPKGPYALAGFSLGGIIAFEMTRQLNAMGERVVFLGMFDTVAQTSQKHLSPLAKRLKRMKLVAHQIGFNIKALATEGGHDRSKMLLWKFRSMQRKVNTLFFNIKASKAYQSGDREKLPEFMLNVHEMNNRAGDNYVLKPSDLNIDLFRAMHQTFYIEDSLYYGWSKYALKGIKVHHVPGEHSTIFWPPYDVGFARILQKRLDDVNAAYFQEIRRKEF